MFFVAYFLCITGDPINIILNYINWSHLDLSLTGSFNEKFSENETKNFSSQIIFF